MFRNKNSMINRMTSVLLIVCMIALCLPGKKTDAASWGIVKDPKMKMDEEHIYWSQNHNSGDDSTLRYYTYKYALSWEPYDLTIPFSQGTNASINKKFIPVSVDTKEAVNGVKKVNFTMSKSDIMDAATDGLKVTATDILNGKNKLYLNPVYRTYKGDPDNMTIVDNWVFGRVEMLAEADWSKATVNNLLNTGEGHYYNIELTLTPYIYNVKIVPVKIENGKYIVLDDAKNKKGTVVGNTFDLNDDKSKLIAGQSFSYTLPDVNKTLTRKTSDGDAEIYNYARWQYTYDKSDDNSSALTACSGNDGSTVYIKKTPDAEKDSTLTIYMVYEQAEPNVFNVEVVAKAGDKTLGILQTTQGVEGKSDFVYEFEQSITKGKTTYEYRNSCTMTYKIDKAKQEKEISAKTKIKTTLPNADNGSTVTFTLQYGTEDITPTPMPTIGPSPTAEPTPTPEIPPVIVPESDYAQMEYTRVKTEAKIKADLKTGNRFTVEQGIPTTESLYGEARATDYIVGYNFVKRVGKKTYKVKVSKDYIFDFEDPDVEDITETVSKTYTVERAYGYWEVVDFGLYGIDNVTLNNYALPNGSLTLRPNSALYNIPTASVTHSTLENYHIIPPEEVTKGITLEPETITVEDKANKPKIPDEDFEVDALLKTGQITVRSDTVIWNGQTVMDGTPTEYDAPDIDEDIIEQCDTITDEYVLYDDNNVIGATKNNGTYGSTGTITYKAKAGAYVGISPTKVYSIYGINEVKIHTPVYCDATITADNDKWVQLISPTNGCVQLVLDEDSTLNDFTVSISNYGYHSAKQGYYTRSYIWNLHDGATSYMAKADGLYRNEVKFPFDVYRDVGTDYKTDNDEFIKAGTWVTIGFTTPRFYLPMWVREGVYTVSFRTVAVNGTDKLTHTQPMANTDLFNYVATDTVKVEVSGRIYGLTMYDVSDYPMWEEAFRATNSSTLKLNNLLKFPDGTFFASYNKNRSYYYTVGSCDQYGKATGRNSKYTFPLVNGSHPEYANQGILKTGYITRFKLTTTGEMYSDIARVVIEPKFYFINAKTGTRTQVDLWYDEEIYGKNRTLVKVGSNLDLSNIKYTTIGDLNLAIPSSELKTTAEIKGEKYRNYILKKTAVFNFSKITLPWQLRTFVNTSYGNGIKALDSYSAVTAAGITENDMIKTKQNWYGEYYLPNKVHAVPTGTDVISYANKYGIDYIPDSPSRGTFHDNWLTNGYIIVNFSIYTVDGNGEKRLSYINADNYTKYGHCSMWILENPPVTKKSDNFTFKFYAGDYVIYYANKRASDDYTSGTIY